MKNSIQKTLDKLDYVLISIVILLFIIGLFSIYSAAGQYNEDPTHYLTRQAVWFVVGLVAIVFILALEYEHYRSLAIPLYVLGVLSLLYVHFFGVMEKGSQRWINIAGIKLQPSEFVKIILIIMLATAIYRITEKAKTNRGKNIKILLSISLLGLIPLYLIYSQPDLGTSLAVAATMGTVLFISGISVWYIIIIFSVVLLFVLLLGYLFVYQIDIFNLLFKSHQLDRIYGWLQPDMYSGSFGYQLSGARMGIGSGRLFGSGFMDGAMSQSGRVPEIHTDFIFTVIGEEFGFIGAATVLILFFMLIYRMIIIAINCRDIFGTVLVTGVIGLLTFQIFQNIGMTIGLMPITGITLPFISYGGSSLLTNMIAIGLVLNVHVNTRQYMFDND
ncbi:rod shape-determining protein RodA [Virgibacillus sp. MSJ-26]|uniref:rod shape-determining protein RodA n=1 Tax=Virgibacillus sp. MSJ-26 TaxID=2841522 RepID=UPI001C0FF794|nr:rod shape-determining protein RodA [Virgibacillus sp. MSJ-26]MBU5467838.1 rod shape-determining protein RodA [Virgibacillus sp. MSJ-26]